MSSLSSPRAVLSCIMYSVMELKYFSALLMSLEPFSTSRALFRMILSLIEVIQILRSVTIQVVIVLPLTVELVSIASVDFSELLLEVGGQVDGGVQVFPDQGVVLHIPYTWIIRICFGWSHNTWWSFAELHFLLSDTEFHKQRQFLCFQSPGEDSEGGFWYRWLITVFTLNEMRYLQTPDWSVDLISSSRWSRMISLMNSYQARISVTSPILPSRTLTLWKIDGYTIHWVGDLE